MLLLLLLLPLLDYAAATAAQVPLPCPSVLCPHSAEPDRSRGPGAVGGWWGAMGGYCWGGRGAKVQGQGLGG